MSDYEKIIYQKCNSSTCDGLERSLVFDHIESQDIPIYRCQDCGMKYANGRFDEKMSEVKESKDRISEEETIEMPMSEIENLLKEDGWRIK